MMWEYACASQIGSYHVANGMPCQDYSGVVIDPNLPFGVAVVCDGAGSLEHAHRGAAFVGEGALITFQHFFRENFKRVATLNTADWEKIAFSLFCKIDKKLHEFAKRTQLSYASLGSTIILLVFFENKLLVAHVGDGRGAYKSKTKGWQALFSPHKGENANETVFFTSDLWKTDPSNPFFEAKMVEDDYLAFTILTDGCENACFEHYIFDETTGKYHDPNRPYSPFLDPNLPIIGKMKAKGMTQQAINETWGQFLKQGNAVLKKETDDKSMILCVKRT